MWVGARVIDQGEVFFAGGWVKGLGEGTSVALRASASKRNGAFARHTHHSQTPSPSGMILADTMDTFLFVTQQWDGTKNVPPPSRPLPP
jgi:hypothetical protein